MKMYNAELLIAKKKFKFTQLEEMRDVDIGTVCWIGLNPGHSGLTYL
jgi:hypothetical protein